MALKLSPLDKALCDVFGIEETDREVYNRLNKARIKQERKDERQLCKMIAHANTLHAQFV